MVEIGRDGDAIAACGLRFVERPTGPLDGRFCGVENPDLGDANASCNTDRGLFVPELALPELVEEALR